ncbi:hypothetical protein Naga_100052g19 [Nannochloropsis gaditana]|uniref:Uncharacterized protein n=1 Tax=Nannochloropsis gaditana TaxID=72520 RepID=W7TNS1_9STRA|nr:hypothetical protein Naga_100052g19 [Nannochloropsis gaditana]
MPFCPRMPPQRGNTQEDSSRRLSWTNPLLGAHHGAQPAPEEICALKAEVMSPCNMWAFVNGQSLDASMGFGNGPTHSSMALPQNTSSVTLVLKSFCTPFSFPVSAVEGSPVHPMVAAKFDVCGTDVKTDESWVCINHFPEEGSWSSPDFDDSAWPNAVRVEASGLPTGFTYIAGPTESSDDSPHGGWETFCRKTVSLAEDSEEGAEPPPAPLPVEPALPGHPSSPHAWMMNMTVEGNCSLVDVDIHDLSTNFGFLFGLLEEHGHPPVECVLTGHRPSPEHSPTDTTWPCAHIPDPCLFQFVFTGVQAFLTPEIIMQALEDPTFASIFDTRNSSSSEFCQVQSVTIEDQETTPGPDPSSEDVGGSTVNMPQPLDNSENQVSSPEQPQDVDGSSQEGGDASSSTVSSNNQDIVPAEEPNDGSDDSSVSITPAPSAQPTPEPSSEEGNDSSVSITPAPSAQPTPEPTSEGVDDSSVSITPAPSAQPTPEPTSEGVDDSSVSITPADVEEPAVDSPYIPPTPVECGETVTFELGVDGPGILFKLDSANEGDVKVRATTCLESTKADTVVSVYDQKPSEGVEPIASNDDDDTCEVNPTSSTASTTLLDDSSVYIHVANKGAYAGAVSLKVHCGVYDRR